MKKRLVVFLIIVCVSLSFASPVIASNAVMAEPVITVSTSIEHEITPFHEFTQIYWRWNSGVLQFRVWSITNGRWLTEWTNANA